MQTATVASVNNCGASQVVQLCLLHVRPWHVKLYKTMCEASSLGITECLALLDADGQARLEIVVHK